MANKNILLFVIASILLFVSGCTKGPSELEEPPGPPKPVADFTYTTGAPTNPTKVTFVNTSQHAETYDWKIGPGNAPFNVKTPPPFDLGSYGKYNVTLTATGPGGQSTVTKEVNLSMPYSKMIIKEVVLNSLYITTKYDTDSDPDLYIIVSGGNSNPVNTGAWGVYNNWPQAEDAFWAMQYGYIMDDITKTCTIKFYDADNPAGGDPDDLIATYNFLPITYSTTPNNAFPAQIYYSQGGLYGYMSVVWE